MNEPILALIGTLKTQTQGLLTERQAEADRWRELAENARVTFDQKVQLVRDAETDMAELDRMEAALRAGAVGIVTPPN